MTEHDPQQTETTTLPPDRLVEALRDIPRMREIKDDRWANKTFEPPPPMISRMGGLAQGCGGLMLTLVSIPMVIAALWYGYYLWGPVLLLSGGVLLIGGTVGVWAGRRTPLIVAVIVLAVLVIVGWQWNRFVPAAGALAPLGSFSLMYAPITMLASLVLVGTFFLHAVTLAFWKRLKTHSTRGFVVWGAVGLALVVLSVGFHLVQQNQRQSWMDDRLDTWRADAAASDLTLGTNANITLGYSFVTVEDDDDARADVRQAELDAALSSGAAVLRLSAGGDMLLDRETPRMFNDIDEKEDRSEAEIEARRDVRFARQQEHERAYLEQVAASDVDLYISDSQYSPYFLVWASDKNIEGDSVPWADFTALHEERIRYYAEQYAPAYYEIVTEPSAYDQFSGVEQIANEGDRLAAWLTHIADLRDAVRDASPETQIGVGIALADDFDLALYEALLQMEGIDFIGFRIFQPAAFDRLLEVFDEQGNPADSGKAWMITETWYGYCLAPQRSMDLDGQWLEVVTAFGATHNASAVLPTDFGCFVEPGGTLFGSLEDPANRTDVYSAWTRLIAEWNAPQEEE